MNKKNREQLHPGGGVYCKITREPWIVMRQNESYDTNWSKNLPFQTRLNGYNVFLSESADCLLSNSNLQQRQNMNPYLMSSTDPMFFEKRKLSFLQIYNGSKTWILSQQTWCQRCTFMSQGIVIISLNDLILIWWYHVTTLSDRIVQQNIHMKSYN